MNITINEDALNWYKEELDLESGDQVRFFVRYGGCSNVQRDFPSEWRKMPRKRLEPLQKPAASPSLLKKVIYGTSITTTY